MHCHKQLTALCSANLLKAANFQTLEFEREQKKTAYYQQEIKLNVETSKAPLYHQCGQNKCQLRFQFSLTKTKDPLKVHTEQPATCGK